MTVDASGNVTEVQDPAGGKPFRATYDASHRVATRTDRRGSIAGFAYDFASKLGADTLPTITASGQQVRPVLKARSVLTAVLVDPASGKGTSGNPGDRVIPDSVRGIVTNPRGISVRYKLDRFGSPVRVEEPYGRVSIATRDAHGRILTAVSPGGDSTKNAWVNSRLTSIVTRVTGATWADTTIIDYVSLYDLDDVRIVYGTNVETEEYFWNSLKKLDSVRVGPSSQPVTKYTYDSRGRVLTSADQGGHVTSYFYAATAWMNTDSVKYGTRKTRMFTGAYGRADSVWNPLFQATRTQYDVLNRVVRAIGPDADTTRYVYDSLFVDSLIDPKGQVYSFTQNALGWVEASQNPGSAPDTVWYDLNGNVDSTHNRRGHPIRFTYDSLDQVVSRTAGGQTTTYAYHPLGQWSAVSNSESTDTAFVKPAARRDSVVTVRSGTRYVSVRSYTRKGARDSLKVVSPWTALARYVYNASGQLDTLVDLAGRKTRVSYDEERLPTGIVLPTVPTALTLTRNFPATHRPSQMTYSNATVNAAIGRYYGYDLLGLVNERVNGLFSGGEEYVYDVTGRLKEVKEYVLTGQPQCIDDDGSGLNCPPNGKVYGTTTTFAYDKVGNRTDQSALTDAGNRLRRFSADSLLYDADGNLVRRWLIADSTVFNQRLAWSALNELDTVKTTRSGVTTAASFGYDGAGRRVRKVVGSTTTRYLWDGDDLLAELDGSGNRVAEYTYFAGIDRPHSVRRGGATGQSYFYATDFPGSVTALIDTAGAIVQQYHYTAFGDMVLSSGSVANALRFAAREHDEESGLYYVRARYYDPGLGRFVSEDPIGLEGGINAYAFAFNNPINATDPLGLDGCPWEEGQAAIGDRVDGWGGEWECMCTGGDYPQWVQVQQTSGPCSYVDSQVTGPRPPSSLPRGLFGGGGAWDGQSRGDRLGGGASGSAAVLHQLADMFAFANVLSEPEPPACVRLAMNFGLAAVPNGIALRGLYGAYRTFATGAQAARIAGSFQTLRHAAAFANAHNLRATAVTMAGNNMAGFWGVSAAGEHITQSPSSPADLIPGVALFNPLFNTLGECF